MHQLLDGAAGHAQAMGATMLEGYPVDPGGQRINQTSGYGAPSSSLKHMDSGASARPPVGAAANPAGSCAASFPDQKKQYAQATTPRARAVALAEVEGPGAALDGLTDLMLESYYLYHAIRADLLRRLGRAADAALAYDAAIARTGNTAEQAFLRRRRRELA